MYCSSMTSLTVQEIKVKETQQAAETDPSRLDFTLRGFALPL